MGYPVKPNTAYDYKSFQADNPTTPLPALHVTDDFANLKTAVDANIDFLQGSFNSDGTLKASAYPGASALTSYVATATAAATAASASATAAASSATAAAASAAAATALVGTSTTSLAIGTGAKTLTTQTGKQFAIGQLVIVAETSVPTNYMYGQVTAYNGGTGSLSFTSTAVGGTGTITDWTVSVSGTQGAKGDTGATGAPGSGGTAATGAEVFHTGRISQIPSGWLPQNGVAVSRATYANLFAFWVLSYTVTMTIASPCVVTWNGHGLDDGDPFSLATSGALPTGLTAGTGYFVKKIDGNTFNLATTPGGTSIVTTGSQSGTHTGTSALCGLGDGSTTFNTQDKRGRTNVGNDKMGTTAAGRVTFAGSGIYGAANAQTGGVETAGLPAHSHGYGAVRVTGTAKAPLGDPGIDPLFLTSVDGAGSGTTGSTGTGSGAGMPPIFMGIWIVKT